MAISIEEIEEKELINTKKEEFYVNFHLVLVHNEPNGRRWIRWKAEQYLKRCQQWSGGVWAVEQSMIHMHSYFRPLHIHMQSNYPLI